MDYSELEQEQLDYIKRNTISVPNDANMFPDPLREPLDLPIVLDQGQENEVRKKLKQVRFVEPKIGTRLTLENYLNVLSASFVGIMDDLLNFDGNIEEFPNIFTKDNRMVFIGTVLMTLSIALLVYRK